MRTLGIVVGVVVGIGLILWGGLVISIRTGFAPVLDRIRRMNRRFTNPKVMRTAGQPGAKAAVVKHIGRVSGKEYATPVAVVPTEAGFAVALPYGTSADWVKNVLAAGRATVVHEGVAHEMEEPSVVGLGAANHLFPERDRRINRIYGVDETLTVRTSVPASKSSRA